MSHFDNKGIAFVLKLLAFGFQFVFVGGLPSASNELLKSFESALA